MHPDERIEDLMIGNLRIIQKNDSFRFGTDSILLSLFAELKGKQRVLDIGTGSGIIPILLSYKNLESLFAGLEIQDHIADMAARSVSLNNLNDRISIVRGDVKNILDYFPKASFDVVVTNPPYKKLGTGLMNVNESNAAARHEILCTIEDIVKGAAQVLVPKGTLYMVNRPDRLCDTLVALRKYKLEPKLIRFVHSKLSSSPILFLLKANLYGGENLKVGTPVLVDPNLS
jgi:tRNA1Val (adenine37-N6)-methyltransferase